MAQKWIELNTGLQILCGINATAFAIEGIFLLLLVCYKIHERSKNREVTKECTEIMALQSTERAIV